MGEKKIWNALILNDYPGTPYAQWVKEASKPIETRMNRQFKYRGDLIICCGAGKSVGVNAGRALCIVDLYDARPMIKEDEKLARIEWHEKRRAHLLRNWRYFSYDFVFKGYYVSGPYQGIFQITIPDFVKIIDDATPSSSTGGINQ